MPQIKFQAREIFRAAKRQGHKLERGHFEKCAIGTICRVENLPCSEKRTELARDMGVNRENLIALEMGFEGYTTTYNFVWDGPGRELTEEASKKLMKNRYYKVGQNLARMAGY